MSTLTPPRANIPIGWVTVNGNKIPATIEPEWLRYLANSLFDRGGGTTGSGTGDLETAQFDDAGIDDLKVTVARLADELPSHNLAAEISALRSRLDALELGVIADEPAKTWIQKSPYAGSSFIDQGPNEGNLTIQAAPGAVAGRLVSIKGGAGGTGAAGSASLLGAESVSGAPGDAIVTAGGGNSTTTTGAKAKITGGFAASAVNAVGGDVEIKGGLGGNGGRGGHVLIQPGVSSSGTAVRGNIYLDGGVGAALSTSATSGFVQMPSCAGAPSGVVSLIPTGLIPIVVDTTNQRAYFYISGTWRYATLT